MCGCIAEKSHTSPNNKAAKRRRGDCDTEAREGSAEHKVIEH
jgi:hypothetical protein